MKKYIFLVLMIISTNFSQTLLFEENFDYLTGTLTSVSTDWSESPTGSVDIQVVTGNLAFNNYPSSGIGNKVALDGGADGRSGVLRTFTQQSGNGNSVYASLLINVTSTADMGDNTSDGDRFFNLKVAGSSSFRCCIFVRQGSNQFNYEIGLGKLNTSTPTWYPVELNINTIYLIVAAYIFQSGDDIARMWINPDLNGPEPLANLEQTSGSDASNLGEVQFRQEPLSGDIEVDGLRLATDWSLAPLPVELSSFSAILLESSVKLEWRTETEVSNYGFEIHRSTQKDTWLKIGFVHGNGNSNSPKDYSFIDENVRSGKVFYRLKQIDTDGGFDYSKVIEVDLRSPQKFELSQNYPNPFNPETTIRISIPESGNVKLLVYNLIGELIAELVNEYKEAGVHTINFNAENLNSGIFIYKLEANGFVQSKKMLLVK